LKVRPSTIKYKQKIATFFTRAITLAIGILTFGVLFQNYYMSNTLILQEVQRTESQTSNLIQGLFDFRLSLLKIHQDSSVKNRTLLEAVRAKEGDSIFNYFRGVDELDPSNTPDIRLISNLNQLVWDDGNAQFYGINDDDLSSVFHQVSVNSYWHLIKSPSELDSVFLLARRTPLVDLDSGEVIGYFIVAFVLNNNFNFIEQIRDRSHANNLVLAVSDKVLASTLKGNERYTAAQLVAMGTNNKLYDDYSLSHTSLLVEGLPTQLSVFAVQSNVSVLKLRDNYFYGMLFTLIAMLLVSMVLRWLLQRRMKCEIKTLMQFTNGILEKSGNSLFKGSKIEEFDYFGRTLEHTFKRLSEQEEQFEDLFNFSLLPTVLWDKNGHLLRINSAAKKQFMHKNKLGEDLFSCLREQLMPSVEQVCSGDISSDLITEVDLRIYRWDLSPIVVDQQIQYILAQGQDITTIAEAEKQSRIARNEAEKSSQMQAEFLAKMSHEVRTPLNGIIGVSQLLKASVNSDAQKEQVAVLAACSEHLLSVLNDILDFSMMEHDKFNIKSAPFKPMAMVHSIEGVYRPLCVDRGLTLEVNTNFSAEVVLRGDVVRLNQVLFNLLNNALKFTNKGKIGVRISLNQMADHLQLLMEVSDSGIGISTDDQKLIFDPFVQAESSTAREYSGSGLGLSIVKNIVELMNGQIGVKSTLGEGSIFTITLPVEQIHDSMLALTAEPLLEQHAVFDPHIEALLVEDNKSNAFILEAFCKKLGVNVTWVTDGVQAIELVKTQEFDLILMDNQLPLIDGIEVTLIMTKQMGVKTPIYACTADDMTATKEAFLRAGAQYVIVKPIREETLRQAMLHLQETQQN
jgi:two-component system, autoinducer 2 sensor kinase/phosphatase LuxQ